MRYIHFWAPAALTALLLAACGGGDGDQSPNVRYTSMVNFGDSLSDVGTYATAGLVASTGGVDAKGGGKYTVNGPAAKNWTELIATQIGVAQPCAAQTGLESAGPLAGLAQAKADHAGCLNYAQGGARVTNPVGPGNKGLLPDPSGALGQLTDPIVNQINRHLAASGGKFSGGELVTVLAGGNDILINLAVYAATVGAGGNPTAAGTAAVTAMGTAGAELAVYIKTMIVANGATHVVVVNLPDVSQTPSGIAQGPAGQGLINLMVTTFNGQLVGGLAGASGVLVVDAYNQGHDQAIRPAQYQLTNVTSPACDPAKSLFDSALVCNANTLVAGDVSHYLYADSVHPTPWGYRLFAQFVTQNMLQAGWL